MIQSSVSRRWSASRARRGAAALFALATLTARLGATTNSGLILQEPPSARSAALANALTVGKNDVSASLLNPAMLTSLDNSHVLLNYRKGLVGDSFSEVIFGQPTSIGSFGMTAGRYDSGTVDLTDGVTHRSVTAQSDSMISLGYAHRLGIASVGVSVKYLRSDLAEMASAHTTALDAGVSSRLGSRFSVGAAIQNMGPSLAFYGVGDPLPHTIRCGAAAALGSSRRSAQILLDGIYATTRKDLSAAVGLEVPLGPLALRAGYTNSGNRSLISAGIGFLMGSMSLDYAVGMMEQDNSQQQFSLSYRFGKGMKS